MDGQHLNRLLLYPKYPLLLITMLTNFILGHIEFSVMIIIKSHAINVGNREVFEFEKLKMLTWFKYTKDKINPHFPCIQHLNTPHQWIPTCSPCCFDTKHTLRLKYRNRI